MIDICGNAILSLMTQGQTLEILKTGANAFLTGEPGSGKTYVLNRYIDCHSEHYSH